MFPSKVTPTMFYSFEGKIGRPVKETWYRMPVGEKCWRAELWAKRKDVVYKVEVVCEEPMPSEEFLDVHMPKIIEAFVSDFKDVIDNALVILRMEGKYGKAYDFERQTSRFGADIYEE